jgi:hypothetical protein
LVLVFPAAEQGKTKGCCKAAGKLAEPYPWLLFSPAPVKTKGGEYKGLALLLTNVLFIWLNSNHVYSKIKTAKSIVVFRFPAAVGEPRALCSSSRANPLGMALLPKGLWFSLEQQQEN